MPSWWSTAATIAGVICFVPNRLRAEAVGLELLELGGGRGAAGEMKDLLNKVIQAQKEAEATIILRPRLDGAEPELANANFPGISGPGFGRSSP